MVIIMDAANFAIQKVLIDNRSSADIIFLLVLHKVDLDITVLQPVKILLVGFSGIDIILLGTMDLPTSIGIDQCRKTMMIKYLDVDDLFTYNIILGQPRLNS